MSFPRESELNFGVDPAVGTLQPGSPVKTRTMDELDQVARKLGTKLITDNNGDTSLSVDPFSRHCFGGQGRIARLERVIEVPVRRGYGSRSWTVERRIFTYDEQGRLAEVKTLRSTTGQLWRIMDHQKLVYEQDGTYTMAQSVANGFMLQGKSIMVAPWPHKSSSGM